MKYIIFLCAFAAVAPAAQWLRRNPYYFSKSWILFGFIALAYDPSIALINWPGWPGYVKGFIVTGLDLMALTLFLNLPKAQRPAPFRIPMGLYFLAMALSIGVAQVPMAAAFYSWQLLRVYFIYIVVRRASSDPEVLESIFRGMTIALLYEAVMAGWQRFGHGDIRAAGSFGDKNLLGFMTEFAIFVPFAFVLAGKRGWQTTLAPVAGMLISILTVSRAAVGLGAGGFGLVLILSMLRKWTPRKVRILTAGVAIILVLAPFAWFSFKDRFTEQPISGGDERAVLNNAASMILHDHPFGVGANNYIVVANSQGYAARAGVPWSNPFAIVHSAYWLTACESGYLGIITFVLLWLQVTWVSLRCAWKYKKDYRGDIMLGLAVTLVVIALHNAYEWVFLIYNAQYMFAITVGMVAALAEQLGYWGARRQSAAATHMSLRRATPAAASRNRLNGPAGRERLKDRG